MQPSLWRQALAKPLGEAEEGRCEGQIGRIFDCLQPLKAQAVGGGEGRQCLRAVGPIGGRERVFPLRP